MKTREQAAATYINENRKNLNDSVFTIARSDLYAHWNDAFLAGCEFEAQSSADLAKSFAKWVELSSWHLDFKEQRTHTIDEKFEYFLVTVWPFQSSPPKPREL